MTTLVIASGNAGKVREFGRLLADLGLETQPQPEGLEVEETGTTFAEMPHSQKAELGHRGRAFGALKPQLRAALAQDKQ